MTENFPVTVRNEFRPRGERIKVTETCNETEFVVVGHE